jgi:hypothetical protein
LTKAGGAALGKVVPQLIRIRTSESEVQGTFAFGSAERDDYPIIVACHVSDIVEVNNVVLNSNEVHCMVRMTINAMRGL